jgi:arsenate reductase (glutaredoxin)
MKVNIQIFGVRKCFDTKKAERYFKERRVPFQFVDLKIKNLSRGELESVARAVGLNHLIDAGSPEYQKLHLDRIISSSMREELLLKYPSLLKTPIVRNGKAATVGFQPEIWQTWE